MKKISKGIIYELCPKCENEVQLKAVFKVQACPDCGVKIIPCALCRDYNHCRGCELRSEVGFD
jgi:predicted RNA-binding Zn-ribbon protein involved in translation (DUF1610 family)